MKFQVNAYNSKGEAVYVNSCVPEELIGAAIAVAAEERDVVRYEVVKIAEEYQ